MSVTPVQLSRKRLRRGWILGGFSLCPYLGGNGSHSLAGAGRWLAILSGFLALWTFWPRRYWSTDLRPFRDKYLGAEPRFTAIRLLDTQIDMTERMGGDPEGQGGAPQASMVALASAVLLVGIGLGLD